MANLVFVDCEAPFGVGAPSVGDMTEFGAVLFGPELTFHGKDCSKETFINFDNWLKENCDKQPVFISDNVAHDWQWINYYFWLYLGRNPFGHSGRRISDFYAGLMQDFSKTQEWKMWRKTKHDHNSVNDSMGNVEAFKEILMLIK